MIRFVKTKLNPARRLLKVIGSLFVTLCGLRTRAIKQKQMIEAAALTAYTVAAWWVMAINAPPAAGPATEDKWKLPLLHVTAFENCCLGTRCGRKAELAGQRNVRAVPAAKRQR